MQVTRKTRLLLRAQRLIFVLLVFVIAGLIAWLSTRYTWVADWTNTGRHSLSEASIELLVHMDKPIQITAYARDDQVLRQQIVNLIQRYQQHKKDADLRFVNPDTVPNELRELGITTDGELLIEYDGRSEHLVQLSEQGLTNALQRVARAGDRWLVFLSGHGERRANGAANHDLAEWVRQLESRGVKSRSLNLAETGAIPDNTSALVIADPQAALLDGEVQLLIDYVNHGGNLLWLVEPDSAESLIPLAESMGIGLLPGTIVDPDPRSQMLGIKDPSMILVTHYGAHAISAGLEIPALLARARPMALLDAETWDTTILMETNELAWSETGELTGEIGYSEADDISGPLALAIALSREVGDDSPTTQRVVVIGDGDFLSNAFLGNIGNLDVGNRLVNWLIADDAFIDIPVRTAPDQRLELSHYETLFIALGFLIGVPSTLVITGFVIWWRRRRA